MTPTVSRVLLIELGGTNYDVLVPLAASGTMPNLARLMQSAALARLRTCGPHHASAARATLETGSGPQHHGRLDDRYLDHRRGHILPVANRPLPCPALADLVAAACGDGAAMKVDDASDAARIWERKPASFQELSRGVAQTAAAMRRAVARAADVDRRNPWRLLQVRLGAVDPLLARLWHLLGIGDGPGGNRRWIAKTREAFRTLDDCLAELCELAARRRAAVLVVSPYGFGPVREKITLSELLRRNELLHVAAGAAKIRYRLRRWAWKARRTVSPCFTVKGLLPIDWRRSRALTLHGQAAALVYLNTPERFGTRTLVHPRQREQAAADAMAALREARHPVSGESLFDEVYSTASRFGCDPLEGFWPEVVAVPRPGLLARHRLDRNRHLVRSISSLSAASNGQGLLMLHCPGVATGQPRTLDLADVAPTVLGMLGLPPGEQMTGRLAEELFVAQNATFPLQVARTP